MEVSFRGMATGPLEEVICIMKANLISEKEVLSESSQIIRLSGELDIHSAPDFKHEILECINKGYRQLIIDLNDLHFMDSRGLGVFIGILRNVKEQGGFLKIVCSNQTILKIFYRIGLSEIFTIFQTLEDAQK